MTGTIIVDARNDSFSVGETQDISANLLANDVVSGSTAAALGLRVTSVNVPGLGVVAVGTQFNVTTAGGRTGVATVNANGTFTFDGGDNFIGLTAGQTDSFTLNYTITGTRAPIAGTTICIEAEHMSLHNYTVEHNDYASGDRVVKGVINQWSTAATTFNGQQGNYNLALNVIDENDGRGTVRILVNGVNVSGDIVLNQDNGGWGTGHTTFRTINVHNLALKAGDRVEIQGMGQHGEFARLDNLKFVATGTGGQSFTDTATVTVHINGEGSALGIVGGRVFLDANANNLETNATGGFDAGVGGVTVQLLNTAGHVVATTLSDAHGNYSFHVAAGHYKVKVVAPGGLQFVTPNVGTNDGIDSDVGADGVTTGLVEVLAGRTVWEVDAGLRPALRVDAVDDRITVLESEAAGDRETLESGATSVLANDTTEAGAYAGAVVSVNGVSGNVGQFIDLAGGGRVRINADGTVDFDADGDFEALNQGQSAQVQVHYTISRSGPPVLDGKFSYDFWNHVPAHNTIHNIPTTPGDYRGTVGNLDVNALALALTHDPDTYKIRFTGNFQVTTGGTYTFNVGGDDGVGVYVNGHLVAARDGIHGFETASGQIHLGAGIHSIELRYFEFNGGQGLTLNYAGPDTGGAHASIFGVLNSGPIHPTVIHDTASVTITVQGEDEPFGIVGGRVFLDANGDNLETNATGGFDGPVAGVTVQLLNLAGQVVATTTSNGNGEYQFHVLAGDYRVKFIAPGGLEFVQNDVSTNDGIDSDAGPGGVTVNPVRVVAGQTLWEVDAGLRVPLAVDAVDDGFSVGETQDISANILVNDSPQNGSLSVLSIAANGAARTVGQSFQVTTEGGRTGTVTVNKDGTFTFDGGNNFVGLNQGQTDRFELHYTAAATTQVEAKYNLLFVLDISNSTIGTGGGINTFNGTGVGDVNGDGIVNTVLDAEIQGVINVINKLRAQGVNPANIDIGLVTFSGVAQGFATVNAATLGTFSLNAANLISTLTGIRSGGWTNYEAGLQEGERWLGTQQGDGAQNRLFFLSDGRPVINNVNGQDVLQTQANYGDEVSRIANNFGAQIHAIGIGANSDLAYLNQIDNTGGAEKVLDVSTLAAALDRATPIVVTDQAKVMVTINGEGAVVVVDAVDDAFSVAETQDISANILANDSPQDGSLSVLSVAANGAARTVGQSFQVTTEGGRTGTVTVNKDGTFTFDGGNNFVGLNQGQTDRFELHYTAAATQQVEKKYNLLFVLDISNSTIGTGGGINTFNGTGVGDVNGDGIVNTVLDAEIQGVINVINKLRAQGVNPANIDIGLVTFSGVAQGFASVDAATLGTFSLNAANLISTLTGIRSGGWTNYEAGLKEAERWLGTQQGDGAENRLFFLSDGRPVINNVNGQDVLQSSVNYGDEVARIAGTFGAQIHAIGIGANSDLAYLNQLDNTGGAEKVLDVGTLAAALDRATPVLVTDQAKVIVTINGQGQVASIDAVDDRIVVNETEAAGDLEALVGGATSILANDTTDSGAYAGAVVTVNGVAGNVGQFIDLAGGGKIKINANGTVDFDADGDFTALNQGQSAEVRVNYSITKTLPAVLDGKLKYDFWNHVPNGPSIVNMPGGTGEFVGTIGNFDVAALAQALTHDTDTFKIRYTGQIQITTGGTYHFTIGGDDGVGIYINGVQVAARDGIHAFESATGSIHLGAGVHNIEIRYFEATGGQGLAVSYQGPDTAGGQSSIFGAVNSGPIHPTTITDTAAVIVTVNGEGQPNILPVAVDDRIVTDEETPATPINVLANDNQGDGPASVIAVQGGTVGQPITLTTTEDGQTLTATATLAADGTLTLVPGAAFDLLDANESRTFTLTYTLRDANGDHSTATITLVVNGLNEGPDARDNAYVTAENVAVSGNLITDDTGAGADSDPNGDALVVSAVTGGSVGTGFAVTTAGGRQGSLVVNADGSFTFTPVAGFDTLFQGQTDTVSFGYTLRDGNGATDPAQVVITLNGLGQPNRLPQAVDDQIVTDEETPATPINVLANDDQGDGPASVIAVQGGTVGQPITLTTTEDGQTLTATATLAADGTLTLVPGAAFDLLDANESRSFTLTYTLRDANGDESTATITLVVNGLNEGPVAQDDVAIASERVAALSGNVLSNDSDPNGDGLSVIDAGGLAPGSAIAVSAVSSAGRVLTGQVKVMANGTYAFAPGAGFVAMGLGETVVFAVDYTARDTFGAIDSATLRVTITGANEGPVATANVYRTDEVTAVSGNVLTDDTGAGVDSDPNGDAITVTAVQGGTVGTEFAVTTAGGRQGSLLIGADGSLEFTPKDGFDTLFEGQTDTVAVTYTITDANGATSTASVTVTIDGVDAKPTALNDALTITESAANSVNLLANDFGGDGALALDTFDGTPGQAGSATTDGGRQVGWSIDGNGNVEVRLLNGAGTLFDGQTDTVTLDYTITDQDGDLAAAQLVVTIQGQGTPPDPTRTLAIVGDVDTLAPPEQGFAVAIDISSRAFTGNARIAVGDLNGDGNTGRAIDGALQMVVNLATTLVAEGRGDQEIGLIAAGFNLTRTDEVTAQEIVDAVRAGNAATTVFSVIGTAPNNPVIGTLPSGQQLRGDTIDLTRALAAADAYLIDEGADTGNVIVLTSTDGFSQSLSTLSPPVGDRVFVSDPTAISNTLTTKGVDVDVVYIEAGGNIAPNALGSALLQIDSDDFVNSVVTAPLIALDTLIDDPQDVVVGQLVDFSLRVNGELIDGIDASDVTVNAAGFDFTTVLDVDLGDALVEVQLGFNTDSDAAIDVVKTITQSVSGDTFQFNVDLDALLS